MSGKLSIHLWQSNHMQDNKIPQVLLDSSLIENINPDTTL